MLLKHFTKSQLQETLSDLVITANIYSSKIIFDKSSIHHLGVKNGDRLVFTRDMDSGDWFFFKTKEKDSFQLKTYPTGSKLAISSKNLCREIVFSANAEAYKVILEISDEVIEYEGNSLYKLNVRKVEMDDFIQWGDSHNAQIAKNVIDEIPEVNQGQQAALFPEPLAQTA